MKGQKGFNPFSSWKNPKAFTLIEILIVLFLLGFLFTFAAQRFVKRDRRVKKTFHQFIRLNNRLVFASKIHNKEYRLVILLDKEGMEQYWVEKKQPGAVPKDQDDEEKKISPYFIDESFYAEPEVIPSFLQILKIESPAWEKEKTEGLAYIYYHPKGLAQETRIYFLRSDNSAEWTLYLDPVAKSFQIQSHP